MSEYDAVIVFVIATIFVSFYMFNEARPGGSKITDTLLRPFKRFFN